MNAHSCKNRSTSIALCCANLAHPKTPVLSNCSKIRLENGKESKAVLLLLPLSTLAMSKTRTKTQFEQSTSSHRAEPVQIWKARKFIQEHSAEELSLRKVAKAVNINANHLSERFRQVTGVNFVDYVARMRFQNACDLLRTSNRRVSEIAFAVGFQSLSQFNRVFKRFSKRSPTQYRAAHLRSVRHRIKSWTRR